MKSLIDKIEDSHFYKVTNFCEPFLTKHKLKKTIGGERTMSMKTKTTINLIAYCDGKNSLEDISKIINTNIKQLNQIIKKLVKFKIIQKL